MASPRSQPITRRSIPIARRETRVHDSALHDSALDDTAPSDTAHDESSRASAPDWLNHDERRESALSQHLPERLRGTRLDPGRTGVLALCALGAIVVIIAGYAVLRDAPVVAAVPTLPAVQPLPDLPTRPSETVEPPARIVVSVVGLVAVSGLVELPVDSRVADALAAAGGPLVGADVLALNLAAKVADGDQIVVGATPPEGRPVVSGTLSGSAPGIPSTPVVGGPATPSGSVDLNTASVAELDALPGVGPVTAASIVAWREVNGPFTDVGQLAEVDGIGPVRLEKLRDQVTV